MFPFRRVSPGFWLCICPRSRSVPTTAHRRRLVQFKWKETEKPKANFWTPQHCSTLPCVRWLLPLPAHAQPGGLRSLLPTMAETRARKPHLPERPLGLASLPLCQQRHSPAPPLPTNIQHPPPYSARLRGPNRGCQCNFRL